MYRLCHVLEETICKGSQISCNDGVHTAMDIRNNLLLVGIFIVYNVFYEKVAIVHGKAW